MVMTVMTRERAAVQLEAERRRGPLDSTDGQAGNGRESDRFGGLSVDTVGRADGSLENDRSGGPSHTVDTATRTLSHLAATRQDFQQLRKAMAQRDLDEALVAGMLAAEKAVDTALTKALRKHPIWPWLSQFSGLGGVHTARLVALIGNPHRFPGQPCSAGHIFPVEVRGENESPAGREGEPCPATDHDDAPCVGIMLAPRPHTGVRSLWHYLGLHVVNGRSPRKTKGQRADWNPTGRTAVLQPDGIADQIVRHRVQPYRDLYDATKERLTRERAVARCENGPEIGPLPIHTGEADLDAVSDIRLGLPPYKIDAIARKVAAKAFVGDLLMAWKGLPSQ